MTQDYLKKLFDYNSETGKLIWKSKTNARSNRVRLGEEAGNLHKCSGYLIIGIHGKNYRAHRLIWMWHYGYFPENNVDHINRNPNDNRLENLREVTHQCNMRNTGNFNSNLSGVKGVYFSTIRNKWESYIRIYRKKRNLGRFNSIEDAVCARLAAEQCIGWSGCDSSSPAYLFVKNNIQ